jgi:hypothetical protein
MPATDLRFSLGSLLPLGAIGGSGRAGHVP